MTPSERDMLTTQLSSADLILSMADKSTYVDGASDIIKSILTQLRGRKAGMADGLMAIADYVAQMDERGVKEISMDDIALGCGLTYMPHSEKIFAARKLQERRYFRHQRRGPDGKMSWYYLKQEPYRPPAG